MKRFFTILLVAMAPLAHADNFFVSGGGAEGAYRTTIGRSFDTEVNFYGITLHPEVSASYWWNGQRSFEVSAVPMLRYHFTQKLYLEGGIGLSYFSNRNFGGQSTNLQFADHLGVGYGPVSLRVSHFSNGGLKNPNPGVNAIQIIYKFDF